MRTMLAEVVGTTLLAVHTADPPTREEWDRYLEQVKTQLARVGVEQGRALAVTEGGGPSFSQRQQLNDVLGGRQLLGSVVSSNAFVRSIVVALNVFNRNIKVFPPSDLSGAFHHLRLPEAERKALLRATARLQAELGIKALPVA